MATIVEMFELAFRYHQQGAWPQAEQICRQILQSVPQHFEALHLLGVLAYQMGRLDEAATYYRQALVLQPHSAEAHNNLGVVLKRQGRLDDALACYQQVLALKPQDVQAHNNLGNVFLQQGKIAEAIACYRQALRLRPDYAEAHNNLGNVLQQQGNWEESIACYRQALRLRPEYADAHHNLGNALKHQGRLEDALASYQYALVLKPDFAEAHHALGNLFLELGKLEEAQGSYRQAVRFKPNLAEVHNRLGKLLLDQGKPKEAAEFYQNYLRLRPDQAVAHHNLGVAFRHQGRTAEAVACYRQAVRLQPHYALAHNNLGEALILQGHFQEAATSLQQALALQPDYAEAHFNLGNLFMDQKDPVQAAVCYRQAVSLKPDYTDAHNSLGTALEQQGQLPEAAACYRQALDLNPENAAAHSNWSMWLLMTGNLEEGWREYEWRWRDKAFLPWVLPHPRWDGSALQGKTILLGAEQGLGDTLHFIRYAPLVKQRGGKVIVACQKPLLRLLANSQGIDRLVAQGSDLPPCDIHAPLLSLPGLFRTTLATIPAQVPYLSANPELVERWRRTLEAVRGLRVGIAWKGDPRYPKDHLRSIPLSHFSRLARVEGVQLVSLQKGSGASQDAALEVPVPLFDLGPGLDEESGAFMDTAAVMKNLDLVITADTVVAHLAGALGVPVWLALSFAPDWRWLLDWEDCPWYPTMRLFRQTTFGDWGGVVQRLATALQERVAAVSSFRAERQGEVGATGLSAPLPDDRLARAWQCHRVDDYAQAESLCRGILQGHPEHGEAWRLLGEVCQFQGKHAQAVAGYRQALRFGPQPAELHNNLGVALALQGQREEAIRCYGQALQMWPGYVEAHNNLGAALLDQGRLDEAVAQLRDALRWQTDCASTHIQLGAALAARGQPAEAAASYQRAIALEPDNAEGHLMWAMFLLTTGNLEEGWREYEWRWRCKSFLPWLLPHPRWNGSDLRGKTILLCGEQGLGDTLHFIRYAPLIKQRGGTVLVSCQKPLLRLLQTCAGIDRLVARGSDLPPFDVQCPLLSLPGLCGTTLATIPGQVPYLSADPELAAHWGRELAAIRAFKVGIAWQGNPRHRSDPLRSVPLVHFRQLAQVKGVQLISLQKGTGANQLSDLPDPFPIMDLGGNLDELAGPFMDTAAVMKNLDLVITSDTAVAHLAGALGVPVWIALAFAPDWRWLLDREDSPWYPTMRLFRQTRPGDWEELFARLVEELTKMVDQTQGVFKKPMEVRPDLAEAQCNRGKNFLTHGQRPEALACFRQAVQLWPDYAEAHNNLGNLLQGEGKWGEAVACYRQVLRLLPDCAEAYNNLGPALQQLGQWEEAAACYRRALTLKPDYAKAHSNLGTLLLEEGKEEEAVACYRRALASQPDFVEAHTNLANVLAAQHKLAEADASYRRALTLRPHNPDARFNWSQFLLLTGNWEEGWREYEWRLRCKEVLPPALVQPCWDGSPLQGKTILLFAEQGLGDTLQFIRYAPLVQQRGGTVVVVCQKPLLRILAACPGIDRLVPQGSELPAFDVFAALLSLPGLFRTTPATIPDEVPYLSANADLVEHWRRELAPVRGYRVGIAWQGSPQYHKDRRRSLPLTHFGRLAELEGVRLVSLQKGPGPSRVPELAERFSLIDLGASLDEGVRSFMDTAAVMKNLDLVITADTAVAHLAGALGVPVWVALSFASDWRWLLDREDSPWYPTMRLFRQTEPGDWKEVFARIAVELAKLATKDP